MNNRCTLALIVLLCAGAFAQTSEPLGKPDVPPAEKSAEKSAGKPAQKNDQPAGPSSAAENGQRRAQGLQMMMRDGVSGTIIEIGDGSLTVKDGSGKSSTLKTTSATRVFSRDRGELALKDLKVGDAIAAGGPKGADGIAEVRFIGLMDAEQLKKMQEMQANLGKTWITGEIKSIDDTKLTIQRPDGQTQVIELDENTSLKKGGESVTLADVKVGDRVMGQGELKNGTFVPKDLRVGTPGMRRMNGGGTERPQ